MPKKPSLPPDTNVCRNPYRTKSGRGKFYSARIGKKVTGSKPIYQRFSTEAEAYRWVLLKVEEYEKLHTEHGKAARHMTPQQYASALTAVDTLGTAAPDTLADLAKFWVSVGKPNGVDLTRLRNVMVSLGAASVDVITKAISYFNSHSGDSIQQRTLRDVFNEWLVAKGGMHMTLESKKKAIPPKDALTRPPSGDYLRGIRGVGRKICATLGDTLIHELSSDKLKDWLGSQPYTNNTRRHYHHDLRMIWNWAIKHRYTKVNPWDRIDLPPSEAIPIGILTPLQTLELLLAATRPEHRALLVTLVVGLFAGVRPKEAERLTWEKIRLNTRRPLIDLDKDVAKTRHRRTVLLSENTVRWLKLIPEAERVGKIKPPRFTNLFPALRNAVGIKRLPRNAFRHSFASYYAAIHGSIKTAEILGHTDLATIKEHYQENVMPEAADAYLSINPDTKPEDLMKILEAA